MIRTRGGLLLASIVAGFTLGFAVSSIGFGDYGELNRMFTFQDLRMFFTFVGAVVIAAVLSFVLLGRPATRTPIHAGIVPGAIMFGVGWAISGGCPAIPIIQLASGYVPAVASLAGLVVGMRACRWFTSRYMPIDRGSCG